MRILVLSLLTAGLILQFGCSKNENAPLEPESPDGTVYTLTVTATAIYYLNLELGDTVTVSDYQKDDSWDLVIDNLTRVRLNGGVTASGSVHVLTLETTDYDAIDTAPDGFYDTDQTEDLVIGEEWYFYDINTHTVNPLDYIYVIKDNNDQYYKFRFTETNFTSQTDGQLMFKFDKINPPAAPEFPDPALLLPVEADQSYFIDLAGGNTVLIDDMLLQEDWDITIDNLTRIRVNGGATSIGEVYVHQLEGASYDDLQTAPDGLYTTDTEDGSVIGEDWYTYDFMTHTVTPKDYIYIIKARNGEYYKMQMINAAFTSQTTGELEFRFGKIAGPAVPEFQDVSGRVRLARLPLSTSELKYFNLKNGAVVEVTDPQTSGDWDLQTEFVTIMMNSGTSGSGDAGAIVYQDAAFDDIVSAPADGYVVDDTLSATMAIGDVWYNYDFMTHQLSAHPYTWVLKNATGKFAKLQFVKTDFSGQDEGVAIIRFIYLENGNLF